MSDVTDIGGAGAAARIWVCQCGCSTFEICDDGTVMCAHCEQISHHEFGGWYRADAQEADEPDKRVVSGNGSIDFLKARLSRLALEDETVGLVLMRDDGNVSFWHCADTKKRVRWYEKRLKMAKRMLRGKD